MKKFIFTAIAVVAFSGVSMAAKKVIKVQSIKTKTNKITMFDPCDIVYGNVYNGSKGQYGSLTANAMAAGAESSCRREMASLQE